MSSYVYEDESRGAGAIAAADLGTTAFVRHIYKKKPATSTRTDLRKGSTRAQQAEYLARRKSLEARSKARAANTGRRTTRVNSRARANLAPPPVKDVIGGAGAQLVPKPTTQTTVVSVPAPQSPGFPVAPAFPSVPQDIAITSRPLNLPNAGLMPSPGLTDAVDELHDAQNAQAEDAMTMATAEAEAATTGIPKPLLIGGIIGGAALLYLLLKK